MTATHPPAEGAGNGQTAADVVLLVEDIHTFYGSIEALKGISLEVRDGEIVTLIGANGAGKSTTLRSISGIVPPRTGRIVFNGREIQNMPGHTVAEIGIAQSPEGRRIFPRMTVLENLEMGAFTRRDQSGIRDDLDRVYTLFPRLKERERQKGGTMSGGEQQMLAIGRALMAQPRLLLLDEPSLGLAPVIVDRIYEVIREINQQGTTIVLVEQNANYALDVSSRGYVLETGHVALSDTSENLRKDERVQAAYLGDMTATLIIAAVGAKAFYLLMIWLASAIAASELSSRKGYGEKWGLGTGLLLSAIGVIVWLVVPARPESRWAQRRRRDSSAAAS